MHPQGRTLLGDVAIMRLKRIILELRKPRIRCSQDLHGRLPFVTVNEMIGFTRGYIGMITATFKTRRGIFRMVNRESFPPGTPASSPDISGTV